MIGGEYTYSDLIKANSTPEECSHIVTGVYRGVQATGTYTESKSEKEMQESINLEGRMKIKTGLMTLEMKASLDYND